MNSDCHMSLRGFFEFFLFIFFKFFKFFFKKFVNFFKMYTCQPKSVPRVTSWFF